MAKPERTFTGQEGQRSTGTAGPEAIKYDLDNLFAALNPDSSFKDGSPGGLGPENFKAQAADDHAIGDREIDDSLNPEANSGRLTLLLSWLGNMIKKVTGESSWRSTPATTLKVAKQHIDASAPHSGHVKSINAIQGGDITLKAGTNVIIGQNAVTKEVTISTSGTIAPSAHASSHSTSGGDRITPAMIGAVATEAGKGLSTNDFTTAEKNKLAGIEAGAQKNSSITKAEIENKLELNALLTTHKSTVVGAINELFIDVGNGKTLIAGAITDRGVPTNPSDTFSAMAGNIREIGKPIEKNGEILVIKESPGYGGDIRALTSDDNYIYVGGHTNQMVKKLNKSDLSVVATSPNYGGDIYALTSDDNFIYVGGSTDQTVKKLNKSNLSVVATSTDYGGGIQALSFDDNFIYVGGVTVQRVKKLNKSNLSVVATSLGYGGNIRALTSDDNYIYVSGDTNQTVKKLKKSDLSVVATSPGYGGTIWTLSSDDNFIYVGGSTDQTVKKLNKSNLSVVATSPGYGGIIRVLTSDDNFIYVGGETSRTVKKLNKSNLSVVATSTDYGGNIRALTSDDNFIYVGGETSRTVKKLNKSVYELYGADYIRI